MKGLLLILFVIFLPNTLISQVYSNPIQLGLEIHYSGNDYKGDIAYIDIQNDEVIIFTTFGTVISGYIQDDVLHLNRDDAKLFNLNIDKVKKVDEQYFAWNEKKLYNIDLRNNMLIPIISPKGEILDISRDSTSFICLIKSKDNSIKLYQSDLVKEWVRLKKFLVEKTDNIYKSEVLNGTTMIITYSGHAFIENENISKNFIKQIHDFKLTDKYIIVSYHDTVAIWNHNGEQLFEKEIPYVLSLNMTYDDMFFVGCDDNSFRLLNYELEEITGFVIPKEASKKYENHVNERGELISIDLVSKDKKLYPRDYAVLKMDIEDNILIEANSANELSYLQLPTFQTIQKVIIGDDDIDMTYFPPLGRVTGIEYIKEINTVVYTTKNGHAAIKRWDLSTNKQRIIIFGVIATDFEIVNNGKVIYYINEHQLRRQIASNLYTDYDKYFKKWKKNKTQLSAYNNITVLASMDNTLVMGNSNGEVVFWNSLKNKEIKRIKVTDNSIRKMKYISKNELMVMDKKGVIYLVTNKENLVKKLNFGISENIKMFLGTSEYFVFVAENNLVSVFDRNFNTLQQTPFKEGDINDCAIYNNQLFIGYTLFSDTNINLEFQYKTKPFYYTTSAQQTSDRKFVIVGCSNGIISFFRVSD
jgi:hypothetical protein